VSDFQIATKGEKVGVWFQKVDVWFSTKLTVKRWVSGFKTNRVFKNDRFSYLYDSPWPLLHLSRSTDQVRHHYGNCHGPNEAA